MSEHSQSNVVIEVRGGVVFAVHAYEDANVVIVDWDDLTDIDDLQAAQDIYDLMARIRRMQDWRGMFCPVYRDLYTEFARLVGDVLDAMKPDEACT